MQPRSLEIEDLAGGENEPHILRLHGPLILSTLFDFQSKVRAGRSHHLILDFTDVPYVDSAGIGALVAAYVRHHRDDHGLSLVGVSERVQAALKLAHIEQFFRFFDSVSQAQASSSAA